MTRVFTILSLGVLIAGLVLAQRNKDFSKPWLAISGTLFVVAIALLVLIMRDQHRAIGALQSAGGESVPGAAAAPGTAGSAVPGAPADLPAGTSPGPGGAPPGRPLAQPAAGHLAAVEGGRVATMGGVVSVIWLVILVLMVWNS